MKRSSGAYCPLLTELIASNFWVYQAPAAIPRRRLPSERRLPPLQDLPAMPIKESSRLAVKISVRQCEKDRELESQSLHPCSSDSHCRFCNQALHSDPLGRLMSAMGILRQLATTPAVYSGIMLRSEKSYELFQRWSQRICRDTHCGVCVYLAIP